MRNPRARRTPKPIAADRERRQEVLAVFRAMQQPEATEAEIAEVLDWPEAPAARTIGELAAAGFLVGTTSWDGRAAWALRRGREGRGEGREKREAPGRKDGDNAGEAGGNVTGGR